MAIKDVLRSYDPNRPLNEASSLPASWYLDPEVAELERRIVFSRPWQPAARLEQLEEAGSYVGDQRHHLEGLGMGESCCWNITA